MSSFLAKVWQRNKQIIVVSASIFIISLTTILFLTPHNVDPESHLQTNLLAHEELAHGSEEADQHKELAKYAALLENPENSYFVLDQDAKVLKSVDSYPEGAFLFDFIDREDQEEVFKYYRDTFSSGEVMVKSGPFRTHLDEEAHVVFFSFIPVPDSEEVFVEVDDVTDHLHDLKEKLGDTPVMEANSSLQMERFLYASMEL